MGDCEAVVGLDGHKDGVEGEGGEKHRQTRLFASRSSMSLSSRQSRTSRGTAQIEVKLPWYMGVTCKV